jgi:TPR repeat protein
MYAFGEGVKADYEEAWFWLTLAEPQKPQVAAYYFDQIRGKVSEAEQEAARERAAEWRLSN